MHVQLYTKVYVDCKNMCKHPSILRTDGGVSSKHLPFMQSMQYGNLQFWLFAAIPNQMSVLHPSICPEELCRDTCHWFFSRNPQRPCPQCRNCPSRLWAARSDSSFPGPRSTGGTTNGQTSNDFGMHCIYLYLKYYVLICINVY